MKNFTAMRIIILALLLFGFSKVFCQFETDTIRIKKNFGNVYLLNNSPLTFKQTNNIVKVNRESALLMKSAKSKKIWSAIFSYTGGFLVGYALGDKFFQNNELNYGMLGAGLGVFSISIPLSIKGSKHLNKAVKVYNADLISSYSDRE